MTILTKLQSTKVLSFVSLVAIVVEMDAPESHKLGAIVLLGLGFFGAQAYAEKAKAILAGAEAVKSQAEDGK